jgi:hypothetical protein
MRAGKAESGQIYRLAARKLAPNMRNAFVGKI